jgi:hypothetical protein
MKETKLSKALEEAATKKAPTIVENEHFSALSTGMKFWVVFPGGKKVLVRDQEEARKVIAAKP